MACGGTGAAGTTGAAPAPTQVGKLFGAVLASGFRLPIRFGSASEDVFVTAVDIPEFFLTAPLEPREATPLFTDCGSFSKKALARSLAITPVIASPAELIGIKSVVRPTRKANFKSDTEMRATLCLKAI